MTATALCPGLTEHGDGSRVHDFGKAVSRDDGHVAEGGGGLGCAASKANNCVPGWEGTARSSCPAGWCAALGHS